MRANGPTCSTTPGLPMRAEICADADRHRACADLEASMSTTSTPFWNGSTTAPARSSGFSRAAASRIAA